MTWSSRDSENYTRLTRLGFLMLITWLTSTALVRSQYRSVAGAGSETARTRAIQGEATDTTGQQLAYGRRGLLCRRRALLLGGAPGSRKSGLETQIAMD